MKKEWSWEKTKKEVDRGHREFFLKRGIDPDSLKEDFLFGGFTKNANNLSSSLNLSDQPNLQSFQDLNHNLKDPTPQTSE